jgi:hypothetical protein
LETLDKLQRDGWKRQAKRPGWVISPDMIAFVIDYLSPAESPDAGKQKRRSKVLAVCFDRKAVVDIANAAIRDRAKPWRLRVSVAICARYVSWVYVVDIQRAAHARPLKSIAKTSKIVSIPNESIDA